MLITRTDMISLNRENDNLPLLVIPFTKCASLWGKITKIGSADDTNTIQEKCTTLFKIFLLILLATPILIAFGLAAIGCALSPRPSSEQVYDFDIAYKQGAPEGGPKFFHLQRIGFGSHHSNSDITNNMIRQLPRYLFSSVSTTKIRNERNVTSLRSDSLPFEHNVKLNLASTQTIRNRLLDIWHLHSGINEPALPLQEISVQKMILFLSNAPIVHTCPQITRFVRAQKSIEVIANRTDNIFHLRLIFKS